MVKYSVEHGANLNKENFNDNKLLFTTCQGHITIIKYVVKLFISFYYIYIYIIYA